MDVYKGFFELPPAISWGTVKMSFSFPVENCRLPLEDSETISCTQSEDLSMKLELPYALSTDDPDTTVEYTNIESQVSRPDIWLRQIHLVVTGWREDTRSALGLSYERCEDNRE